MDCIICQENLVFRAMCSVTPCGHSQFHYDCFQKWAFEGSRPSICPLCNQQYTSYHAIPNTSLVTKSDKVAYQLIQMAGAEDETTVADCMNKLARCCSTNYGGDCLNHRHNFQRLYGHAIVSGILKRWNANVQIQKNGLLVLINGSHGDWNSNADDESLLHSGVFESIFVAMQNHPSDAMMQHYGIGAMRNITEGQPHTIRFVIAQSSPDGMSLVMTAMESFSSHLGIQMNGSRILLAASCCDKHLTVDQRRTALNVLSRAMQHHPSNAALMNVAGQAKANIGLPMGIKRARFFLAKPDIAQIVFLCAAIGTVVFGYWRYHSR